MLLAVTAGGNRRSLRASVGTHSQEAARRLLKEQDTVLRSFFARKGGTKGKGKGMEMSQGRESVGLDIYISVMRARVNCEQVPEP
jgi:hypothetical protein